MARVPIVAIPTDTDNVTLTVSQREVRLTNLRKPFWPALGITKGALIQYYVDVAPVLVPHIADRAKRPRKFAWKFAPQIGLSPQG